MPRLILHRSHRRALAGLVLLALLFQAAIPAGFMPATDGSFSLKICHGGMPEQSGHHSRVEFCSFGALTGFAPVSQHLIFVPAWVIVSHFVADCACRLPSLRLERAHPARGPPALP